MKILELPFGATGVNFEHSSRYCNEAKAKEYSPLRTLINYSHMVNPHFLKSCLFGLLQNCNWVYCGSFLEFRLMYLTIFLHLYSMICDAL